MADTQQLQHCCPAIPGKRIFRCELIVSGRLGNRSIAVATGIAPLMKRDTIAAGRAKAQKGPGRAKSF